MNELYFTRVEGERERERERERIPVSRGQRPVKLHYGKHNIYRTEVNCLFESECPALTERPTAAKTPCRVSRPWRSLNLTLLLLLLSVFFFFITLAVSFYLFYFLNRIWTELWGPPRARKACASWSTTLCSASYLFDHLPPHSSRAWLMFIEGAAEHVTSTPKHDLRNKIMRTSHYRQSAKPRTHGADIVICLFDVDFTL